MINADKQEEEEIRREKVNERNRSTRREETQRKFLKSDVGIKFDKKPKT